MGKSPECMTHDKFPRQGDRIGRKVLVWFHGDAANSVVGTIVRDDMEVPVEQIIRLENGRYVRGAECQFSLES